MPLLYFKNNYKTILLLTGIISLLVSILLYDASNLFLYRCLRIFVCLGALALMTLFKLYRGNLFLFLFMFFYAMASITIIWYEHNSMAVIAIFLHLLAFFSLVYGLWPKTSFRSLNSTLIVVFVLTLLVNGYLLYKLISMIKAMTLSDFHYVFLLLTAMCIAFVSFLTLLYNHEHGTTPTLVFTFFIFSIIFSEVFSAMGYYFPQMGSIFAFASRTLLILGLSLVIHYLFLKNRQKVNYL